MLVRAERKAAHAEAAEAAAGPPHSIIGRRAIIADPGYLRGQHNVFGQIGDLLLDGALGEFDVETKVSYIEFGSVTSQADLERSPLAELPARFDALVEKVH